MKNTNDARRRPHRRHAYALAAALVLAGGLTTAVVSAGASEAVGAAGSGGAQRGQVVAMTATASPPATAGASQGSSPPAPAGASGQTATRPARSSGDGAGTGGRRGGPGSGAAQLAAAQLPAPDEKWRPSGTPSTHGVEGHDIAENECASVVGARTWTQQSFSGGDGANVAIQDTFTFPDAAAASRAYQTLATGMAGCQATSRALQNTDKVPVDAKVAGTAGGGGTTTARSWVRHWTGVMGMSAAGPQTNHVYAAVNGGRLIVLQFTEFPGQAAAYDDAADPGVLAQLRDELAG